MSFHCSILHGSPRGSTRRRPITVRRKCASSASASVIPRRSISAQLVRFGRSRRRIAFTDRGSTPQGRDRDRLDALADLASMAAGVEHDAAGELLGW